jgi:hypothetical protein
VPRKIVEVQGRDEVDWVSQVTVDVPDAVLRLDDPDALSEWVGLNVPSEDIKRAQRVLTVKVEQIGADIVPG